MNEKIALALMPLVRRVRTDARGVKKKGGKPYKQDKPLDLEALKHHVNGGPAYGAYPIRPGESVCSMAVLDLDSHKGETPWTAMQAAALEIANEADKRGLAPHLVRSSGGSGIHVIFTWATAQDARSVRAVMREILAALGYSDGAGGVAKHEVEIFPKQDRVALGAYGNYFFLPGAFASVPLDDFTAEPGTKEDFASYRWRDSAPVPIAPEEQNPRAYCNIDADLEEVASAVASIPNPDASDPNAVDYETWFRIVAGIHSADPGEDGREIAETWSEQSDKHSRAWFEHTWAHLKPRDDGVGVGTIFKLARANGWDRWGPAISAALDSIDIEAADAAIPASGQNQQVTTPGVALPIFMINRFGVALPNLTNVKLALANPITANGVRIGYDEFRDELMIAERPGQWRPLNDVDMVRLRMRFEAMQGGIPGIGREIMRDAVAEIADANRFDSAIDWLEGLQWDGVPRIERFFADYFGADDTPYTRATSLYLWTALAGRILVPGIQADIMPILVGEQGLLKSTAVAAIVPDQQFFVEINLTDKDSDLARLMRGKLVVELGELKGMRAREVEHTKAFVTRRHESWVPKFREFSTTYPRRCVLIGTTNDDEFIEDSTGARRFNPIRVARADREAIERDRLQLWAEAAATFRIDLDLGGDGVIWQDAERLAREVHAEFTHDDIWTESVERWLAGREEQGAPFTAAECLSGALLLPGNQLHSGSKRRLALILKRLGYEQQSPRVNGRRMRVWGQMKNASESGTDGTDGNR